MPVSKAQQKAVNKYMTENYDRINLVVPKGRRDELRAKAKAEGKSLNAYIVDRINGGNQYITPEALDKATKAAQAAGEDLEAWITRAISDTAARDSITRQLKR